MGLFNPAYALVIPSLFLVTVPLAVFAGITTTLAFSVLIFRVLVVYLDIALSFVPQSLSGLKARSLQRRVQASSPSSSPHPMLRRQQQHHRRRRSSASAISGSGSSVSERGLGLMPSVGAERDYEGIGGWRVGDEDDEVWTMVNPKIEMPERPYGRSHARSASGGPTTPGEGGVLMMKGRTRSPETRTVKTSASPNSSRARTPTGPRIAFTGMGLGQNDGYFPSLSTNASPKTPKKISGNVLDQVF